MKKRICYILIIVISIIIFFSAFSFINYKNRITKENNIEKQNMRDITFEPYSNENNLKILVTAEDTESSIEKLKYFEDGKEKQINCNGKTKIAIDYEVSSDGEYKFSFINKNGNTFEKTLQINNDYKENLIKIQSNSNKTLDIEANITIDYSKLLDGKATYKIGEKETNWTNYQGQFTLTSYQVLEKNLQNNDNRTVSIYAKSEDKAKNSVIISKNIVNLDLDMPQKPEIKILEIDKYATISANGIAVSSRQQIVYDSRNDITNYYSLDNCKTWIKVDGYLSDEITGFRIWKLYAKSIKNESGLEIEEEMELNPSPPSANDAIGIRAYDGDTNTSFTSKSSAKILVDSSAVGQTINVTMQGISDYSSNYYPGVSLLNENGQTLYSEKFYSGTHSIKILEGTKYFQFAPYNPWGKLNQLIEITLVDQPKINSRHIYPEMFIDKVEESYEIITITYRANDITRLYKINDGEYEEYNNQEIKINKGDTIYAKAINSAGYETRTSKYTYVSNSNTIDIGINAYDGNYSTAFTTKTPAYLKINDSIIGKTLKIRTTTDSWISYQATLSLLDQNSGILYSEKAYSGTHNIKILEGTKYLKFTPYNAWNNLDQLIEIEIIN